MKRIKISLFAVLAASLLAQGCQDNREANMVPNEVYVVNSDKVVATLYDTGADAVFNIGVTKSGYVNVPATANIVVSAQALANYNAKNSLTLKALPEDCYQIVSTTVNFTDKQVSALYPVIFKTEKLLALGADLASYVLPLELTQSNLQINFNKKFSILVPVVKPAVITMDYAGENAMTVDKNSKTLLANLPVSIPFANSWNIGCTFTSTKADFDAFNATKGGALTMIPEDAYTITPAPFSLTNGKQKDEIFVSIDRTKLSYASYCLPVRLASTDQEWLTINSTSAVAYLTVNTLVNIARDNWTVVDRSSESTAEGTNGAAALAIDADAEQVTYWHSAYESGAVAPHHVTIDLGKNWIVGSIIMKLRNDPHTGYVEVSSDNATWTKIGDFTNVPANKAGQAVPLVPTLARYMKIVFTNTNAMVFDIKAMGGTAE